MSVTINKINGSITINRIPVCSFCKSDKVRSDASAYWDVDLQEWTLAEAYPANSVCENCGGECSIEWLCPKPLEEFDCYVWKAGEELCGAAMNTDGSGNFTSPYEITAPEDQVFLDAVNLVLGTDYKFNQFAGR